MSEEWTTLLSYSHFSQHSWTTITSTPWLGLWSSRQTDSIGTHFLTFQWACARKSPEIVEIWIAGRETEEALDNSEVRELVPNWVLVYRVLQFTALDLWFHLRTIVLEGRGNECFMTLNIVIWIKSLSHYSHKII